MTTSDLKLIGVLNDWIFRNVWNEPRREQRRNIRPAVVSKQPQRARVQLQGVYLSLPIELNESGLQVVPSYFVFYLPEQSFTGIDTYPDTDWVTLEEINNKYHIEVRAITDNGIVLVRSQCYLRHIQLNKGYVLAVSAKMLVRLLGNACDLSSVSVQLFKDSDDVRDLKISSIVVSKFTRKQLQNPPNLKYLLHNGQIVSKDRLKYAEGDYLEYVTDNNIQLSYFVNYTSDAPYYSSGISHGRKLILHMPKDINPKQLMITHNTCDFVVYNKTQQIGRVISRVYGDGSIQQLTHCDYAIDTEILDIYCNALRKTKQDEFGVMVLTRSFGNNNSLVRDSHYIYLLYTLTDEEIVTFLVGLGDPTLPFWTARSLESNLYLKFMTDTPDTFDRQAINDYIDGMGYFNIVSLLSDRYTSIKIETKLTESRTLTYELPLILRYEDPLRVEILGYRNGIKLDDTRFTYLLSNKQITITLDASVPVEIGDVFSFETIPVPVYRSAIYDDLDQGSVVTLPKDEYAIYESSGDDTAKLITGMAARDTWAPCDDATWRREETPTEYQYILQKANTGIRPVKYFFFTKTRFSKAMDVVYKLEEPNFYGLGIEFLKDSLDHPVLGDVSAMVFVNGKSLVRDIDYQIRSYTDTSGREIGKQLLIQNVSYIDQAENRIEAYVSSDLEISNAYGFFCGNEISDQAALPFWFDQISKLYLDGILTDNVKSYLGELILHTAAPRQGALYGVSTQVPEIVLSFLGDHGLMDDLEKLNALKEYFVNRIPIPKTDFEIIPYSHHLYSIYTSAVIGDMIAYDETTKHTARELRTKIIDVMDQRDWIKEFDIPFQDYVDRRYIDIFPNYCRLVLNSRHLYNVISTFVTTALQGDTIQDKEQVHE